MSNTDDIKRIRGASQKGYESRIKLNSPRVREPHRYGDESQICRWQTTKISCKGDNGVGKQMGESTETFSGEVLGRGTCVLFCFVLCLYIVCLFLFSRMHICLIHNLKTQKKQINKLDLLQLQYTHILSTTLSNQFSLAQNQLASFINSSSYKNQSLNQSSFSINHTLIAICLLAIPRF